jgi:hypothetical protein
VRPSPRFTSAPLLGVIVVSACRSLAPQAPLPPDWRELATPPSPFAALYRLSCCGERNLVLTVRGDAARLSVTVVVPPGGTAVAAWIEGGRGWVRRPGQGCREALPPGVLPLSQKASIPLDPELALLILSGVLPPDAREMPDAPGWVEGSVSGLWWRARVEATGPRCTHVVVGRAGAEKALLTATLSGAHGRTPERVDLKAPGLKVRLDLQAWRDAGSPSPPTWIADPPCGGRS